jgi:hypothetical protein
MAAMKGQQSTEREGMRWLLKPIRSTHSFCCAARQRVVELAAGAAPVELELAAVLRESCSTLRHLRFPTSAIVCRLCTWSTTAHLWRLQSSVTKGLPGSCCKQEADRHQGCAWCIAQYDGFDSLPRSSTKKTSLGSSHPRRRYAQSLITQDVGRPFCSRHHFLVQEIRCTCNPLDPKCFVLQRTDPPQHCVHDVCGHVD